MRPHGKEKNVLFLNFNIGKVGLVGDPKLNRFVKRTKIMTKHHTNFDTIKNIIVIIPNVSCSYKTMIRV